MSTGPADESDSEAVVNEMWAEELNEIASMEPESVNWRQQCLPIARVKKIMKTEELIFQELEKERREREPAVVRAPQTPARFMISGDAPIIMEKACEFLVKELSLRSWGHTERNRRRTVQRSDVHAAVGENEMFDFLIDIVPRVLPPQPAAVSDSTKPPAHAEAAASVDDEQHHDDASSSVKLSDAETRYNQLQEMQNQMHEHYSLMQRRAQAEGTLGLSGLPALSQDTTSTQQPQVVLNPQLVIHPPNGAAMPQWQPAGTTTGDDTNNDGLPPPDIDI